MNTDNLDGLINFHAINFPAPKEVKAAFAEGVKSYEEGNLSTVEKGTFLGAKKLATDDGKVGAAWVRKGLEWWEKHGGSATEEERNLYGGEKGKVWFEKCVTELETREKSTQEEDEANLFSYKALDGEFKDVDQMKGIVAGYAAKKNNWDSAKEMIMDGSMTRSIAQWGPQGKGRIKTLWQHNPAYPVGRPTELKEDANGLYHVSAISKTSTGKDVLRLIADQVITEQSIGYTVLDAEPSGEKSGHWHLKELKLFEYSFVIWGANEFTPIHSVKSMGGPVGILRGMKEMVTASEKALRSGDWETEEVPVMIELQSKKLQSMIKALEGYVNGEDEFEAAKPILLKTASTAESDKTPTEPEVVTETLEATKDEDVLAVFKAASFVNHNDATLENDLKKAFKSFQFLEENTDA